MYKRQDFTRTQGESYYTYSKGDSLLFTGSGNLNQNIKVYEGKAYGYFDGRWFTPNIAGIADLDRYTASVKLGYFQNTVSNNNCSMQIRINIPSVDASTCLLYTSLFNCSAIRPPNGLWKTSSQPLCFVAAIRSLVCQINDWFLHISSI